MSSFLRFLCLRVLPVVTVVALGTWAHWAIGGFGGLLAFVVVRRLRMPDAALGSRVYPLDYIDTGGLAITSRERGCSGTPTWRLVVAGAIDPAHVRAALASVAQRYPVLKTKVRALDGIPPWTTQYRYIEDSEFTVDAIFRIVDVQGQSDAAEALAREERSRHLDLFADFPMTLTMAILGPDRCELHFRQHHGIADGRAFMALLADFGRFLEAARTGTPLPAEAILPVPKRSEAEPLGLTPARQAVETLAGFIVLTRIHLHRLLFRLQPLLQNEGNDYSGENATVHRVVPDSSLEQWNRKRRDLSVSLNSFLTGAWLIAVRRWHEARKAPVGRTSSLVLQETRPRDGAFVSFGNHLAFPEVELRLDQVSGIDAAARTVQVQMEQDRRDRVAIRRMLAERALIGIVPLAILQRIALHSPQPLQSTSFSNLIPLSFPVLEGRGWRVEQVWITTPVQPRTGISLTVIRYNGEIVFNVNYKSSVVTRPQVEALADLFVASICPVGQVE